MNITRREFLKACAAATTMAVAGCIKPAEEVPVTPRPVEAESWVRSTCRFCSLDCGVMIGVTKGKVVAVKGDKDNPINKGLLCVKGFNLPYILYAEDRLKKPLIRKDGKFVEATWEEALNLIAGKFKESIEKYGPASVAYYGSGQLYTEESYTMNKIMKAGLKTNNVEGQPRLCMASAVTGYITTYGADEPVGSLDDIEHSDLFFIIGNNTSECHPIVFMRLAARKAANPNVKVILADYRKTATAQIADLHLPFLPGKDLALLNAMAYVCIREGFTDEEFIKNHVSFRYAKEAGDMTGEAKSYHDYKKFLEDYTPEKVAPVCGIPADDIYKAARMFGQAKTAMSLWCMGLNQRVRGTAVNNLMHNLHLITGKVGKPGCDSFSLTGQPNACGGIREIGALSHMLPGHRLIANEKHRNEMEELWGVPKGTIAPAPGLHTIAMFDALAEGKIKCIWIACTNAGQSLPNLNKYRSAMQNAFTVVSEAYHPTRVSELASVVLPAAMWCEKTGVYGNTDRRSQISPQAVESPGEAKPDWLIFVEFAKKMGLSHLVEHFKTSEDIWNEWRRVSKGTSTDLYGMSYDRLKKTSGGFRWPCPTEEHPGTLIRYVSDYGDPFAKPEAGKRYDFYKKPDKKAWVWLRPQEGPAEPADADYPFTLTTGRVLEHWHSGTMTMKAPALKKAVPEAFVEINPKDANKLGIATGDMASVTSRRGTLTLKAKVADVPREGCVFIPWFDADRLVNLLTIESHDPISRQPEFKICGVKVAKA